MKVCPAVRSYTFEVACRLFMSIEEPAQIAKLASLFHVFIKGVISIPLNFPGTRFFKANRATDAIRKELQMIVRKRRVELEQKTVLPSQDLLSHLLANPDENGCFMPESVIINNTLLLLFAGHDTSSSAITMLIKYLAELPEIYEQVLQGQALCIIVNLYTWLCSFSSLNIDLITFVKQSRKKFQHQKKGSFCSGRIYRR